MASEYFFRHLGFKLICGVFFLHTLQYNIAALDQRNTIIRQNNEIIKGLNTFIKK